MLTIKCHEAAVWAVLCLGDKIITGSADKTIKVSNSSGNVVKTLKGKMKIFYSKFMFLFSNMCILIRGMLQAMTTVFEI